jgi:hypothetical protein
MICYHSINGITNSNNLKGASTNQQQQFIFPTNELSLLTKSLELSKFYIERNKDQFQDPNDMLQKINQGINIISSKTNKSKKNNQSQQQSQQSQQQKAPTTTMAIKGASDIARNNNDGYRNLINIRQRFGLLHNNNNALKGASNSKSNNNNNCSKKEHLKDLLK